jgi:hypothetical protein
MFDYFNYASNYYDYIFDYTAFLTISTASPTASTSGCKNITAIYILPLIVT